MSTTSLSDRYIWAVTRQLSAGTGPDVARELRSTLAEAIEDRVAAGEDPPEAERSAIAELGDPDVLARDYGGKPQQLIGPGVYADYVRLVRMVLVVIVPIVVVVRLLTDLAGSGPGVGEVVGGAVWAAADTTVHLVFWTTLVFVLIERGRGEVARDRPLSAWEPDHLLSSDVPWRRPGLGELIAEVAIAGFVAALVVWQFSGVGEHGVQVLDPDLGLGWKGAIVAFLVLDAVLAVAVWRAGRWTPGLATANALANVTAALVLVGLLYADRLLTDLPRVLGDQFGLDTDWAVSYPLVAAGIILVCGADAVNSVVRAWRARRGVARAAPDHQAFGS